MKTLIKNGIIVTDQDIRSKDLLIRDGKIAAIGDFSSIEEECDEVYDVEGCYVMPGLIDPHTHMELQQSEQFRSIDDFYSGTVAAAVGGTTSIIDHIAFGPKGCNLHYSLDRYHELAKKSVIDYSFHGVIQHVDEEILQELDQIVRHEGIASFKAYSTYGYAMSDLNFYKLLKQLKESGGLLTIHCENDDMTNYLRDKFVREGKTDPIYHAWSRPNETEEESIDTLLNLASMVGDAPVYIVHTSTEEGAKRIKLAREEGQKNVYSETCTQYLTLTEEEYVKNGPVEGLKYTMAPPLRQQKDIDYLWKALANGTVQTVATDHCPFYFQRDKLPARENFTLAPGGAPGVEERPRVIFSEGVMKGRLSLTRFVEVMSTNAAKIFGMYPQKGALIPGGDGDITVIDPRVTETLTVKNQKGNCDYNVYEGMEVHCSIHLVFSRGKLVAKDNEFLGQKGEGKFIHRKIREQNIR